MLYTCIFFLLFLCGGKKIEEFSDKLVDRMLMVWPLDGNLESPAVFCL